MSAHGIMFHHFHDDVKHIKEQGSISKSELLKLVDYYDQNYNLLNADIFLDKALMGTLEERDTCITFDDALLCQYDIAESVLKDRGLTAFWFVYTSPLVGQVERLELYRHFRHLCFDTMETFYYEFEKMLNENKENLQIDNLELLLEFKPELYLIDSPFYTDGDKRFRYIRDVILDETKYFCIMDALMEQKGYDVEKWKNYLWMTQKEVKKLEERGNIIGLHSHSHSTVLKTYSYEKQYEEYKKCKDVLSSFLVNPIKTVSYPCGSYNTDTEKIMSDLGIDVGFTPFINDSHGRLFIPREDHANIMRKIK